MKDMIDLSKIKFQHSLYEYHTVGQVLAAIVANFGMPVILAELSKIALIRDKREIQELIAKE